jgi:hypothetical protein
MVAVAVVALALFGSLYLGKLKRLRDRYLAMAAFHLLAETRARAALAGGAARYSHLEWMDQEPVPPQPVTNDPAMAIDLVSGLPTPGFGQLEEEVRFREDQAMRERAITASRRRLAAEYRRRDRESRLRKIDYHAAMARKYRAAARHPWLPVEPDPPEPG